MHQIYPMPLPSRCESKSLTLGYAAEFESRIGPREVLTRHSARVQHSAMIPETCYAVQGCTVFFSLHVYARGEHVNGNRYVPLVGVPLCPALRRFRDEAM